MISVQSSGIILVDILRNKFVPWIIWPGSKLDNNSYLFKESFQSSIDYFVPTSAILFEYWSLELVYEEKDFVGKNSMTDDR